MNLNKAIIVGRVTADPQLRTTPGGASVTAFSIATNRVWKGKDGKQEETEFHNIVAWGRTAEIASQFLQKGALVLIEGRLRTRSWQDKQGQTRKTTEIICEALQLGPRAGGGSPPTGGARTSPSSPSQSSEADAPAPVEDIPIINLEEDIKVEDLPF